MITRLILLATLFAGIAPIAVSAKDADPVVAEKPTKKIRTPKTVHEALSLAKKEGKLAFIQLGREKCGNCTALAEAIKSEKYVLPETDFLHFELNCDDPKVSAEFDKKFKVKGQTLPFVAIADLKGKPLATNSGYVSQEKFDAMIATAMKDSGRVKPAAK